MSPGYQYDDTGQYNFFVMSVILLALVPWTIYEVNKARSNIVKPPCAGWNVKDESVKRVKPQTAVIKKRHLLLAVGWAVLAFTTYQASLVKLNQILYDPFDILGISTDLDEKAIKRHYKRLTLKFHPDKLKLGPNQTKEEADAHFVDLTKAYKALTDETIRRNYELYGHPDGKQDFSMGIAIPKSFIAAQNNIYVLGLYAILFGVALPYFVGRWWFGSRSVTKDGILNTTAATCYLNMREDMDLAKAIEVVSAAQEFEDLLRTREAVKSSDYDRLQNQVKEQLKTLTGETFSGTLYRKTLVQKAAILIYAHLLRTPISDKVLLADKQAVVKIALKVTVALKNIVLSHSWLSAYLAASSLQQAIVQGLHPALPPLLQLPHVQLSAAITAADHLKTVDGFVSASDEERQTVLKDLDDQQASQAVQVAEHWPNLVLEHAAFKVIGEQVVTPGSVVQLIVKVRMVHPKREQENGTPASPQDTDSGAVTPVDHVHAEEQDFDELIGRRPKGSDGEEPNAYAHAPRLPLDQIPGWHMFVGDQKLDRVFIQPQRFTDIGAKTRTLRIQHPAPPHPGLYTFQLFIKSDCYLGTDIRKDMQMRVESVEALDAAEQDEDDDISDPEEDTLAGQMALMKGQKVKRVEDDYDAYETSDSEEEDYESDQERTTSESDLSDKE